MNGLIHWTKAGLEQAKAHQGVLVLDFWAAWCPHCGAVGEIMEGLAQEYDGRATIGKVDVDSEREIAVEYGVRGIPTVVILKDGVEADRKAGEMPASAYAAALDALLG